MGLSFLETIGLTKKESEIYELLLQEGELPVHIIVSKTKLKRGIVYKSLYGLEENGLVTKKDINKKIHFKPLSPALISTLAENQIRRIERAQKELRTLLPDMINQYITSVEKPVVTTYQGIDGLKRIYEDTLLEGKPIFAALTTGDVEPKLFSWLTTTYTKRRVQSKIPVKVIVASGGWAEHYVKKNEKELRQTKLVSNEAFPFQHEVDIYGDKVAFIDFRKGGSLIGIVIHHPHIAMTMRALWELSWTNNFQDHRIPSK